MKCSVVELIELKDYAKEIVFHPAIVKMSNRVHHRRSNRYLHCLYVTMRATEMALKWPGRSDLKAIIRGGMLHDFYGYIQSHHDEKWHRFHMYRHPEVAYDHALRLFPDLSETEKDIILHHMWPVTLTRPFHTREAFFVSMADKEVAMFERFSNPEKRLERTLKAKHRCEKYINKLILKEKKRLTKKMYNSKDRSI